MTKCIKINNCFGCPHKGRRSIHGSPSCVPTCDFGLKRNNLPYREKTISNKQIHAEPTGEIPDWCPLADLPTGL